MTRVLRTTSFRLATTYVAVFALSAIALGLTVFWAARSALKQQMALRIQAETTFLREEFGAGGMERLVSAVRTRGRGTTALDYLVQSAEGTRLAGEIPSIKGSSPGWHTVEVADATEDGGHPEQVLALVSDLGGGQLLVVGDDLSRIDEIEEAIVTAFGWTVGLAALLGIAGGIFLSHAFLRRVDAITGTAEGIIGGDLTRRVPLRGSGDDLDRLSVTLNHMLDRIASLMTSLRQVSSDVAHDLRTPLTRLYQRLDDAHARATTVADYRLAVEAALRDAEQLLNIFAALLRIAQIEGSAPARSFSKVDLGGVVEAIADAYGPDATAEGRTIATRSEAGCVIDGDRELLTQAIANLVENALSHTPSGTQIDLALRRRNNGHIHFSISDNGPGVDDADLPRLTQRFYRGERSRTTPGNGLGLSLVAAVAELHGAELKFRNLRPGFAVRLVFPAPHVPEGN